MGIRVKYIPTDDGREIAYFPETQRFFFVDGEMKDLIEDFSKYDRTQIIESYHIDDATYDDYLDKMVYKPKKKGMSDGEEKKGNFLPRLVIHLANDCNLRCVYCYANGGSYRTTKDIMGAVTLDRILELFYSEYDGIDMVQLFGGEPLMNLDMMDRACRKIREIDDAREIYTDIGLVTNGTLINDRFIELVKKYRLSVTVSFDGMPEINDRLRVFPNGTGASEVILEKMHFLQDALDGDFSIEATYSQYHKDAGLSVLDVYDYIHEMFPKAGVHVAPAGGTDQCDFALKNTEVFPQSVSEVADRAAQDPGSPIWCHASALSELQKLKKKDEMPNDYFCGAGTATLAVSTKGDIYPCFMLLDLDELRMGNVFDEDVLHSRQYVETLDRLMSFCYKYNHQECMDCFINTTCCACLGQFYLNTGETFRLSPKDCERYKGQVIEAIKGLARIQEAEAALQNNKA